MKNILKLLFLLIPFCLKSQEKSDINENHSCAFDKQMAEMYQLFPDAKSNLEKATQQMSEVGINYKNAVCIDNVTIPVVFHYLYDANNLGSGYDSDSYIINTVLAALNNFFAQDDTFDDNLPPAFAGTATDGTCIDFCLSRYDHPQNVNLYGNDLDRSGIKDADGNGIIDEGQFAINRYAITAAEVTDIFNFGASASQVNYIQNIAPAWSHTQYLNIYVVPNVESGVGGYTYLPGNNTSGFNSIYMSYNSATASSTLAHEAGHWLGLNHVWGPCGTAGNCCGNEDFYLNSSAFPVNDTYPQEAPSTFGVNCNGITTDAQVPQSCGTFDNLFNIMDYGSCTDYFTNDQANYMLNTVLNLGTSGRSNFGNNINVSKCVAPTGCLDVVACNYNSFATIDDGSCVYPDCAGNCSGTATGPAQPGTFCDDGDPCTSDLYDNNCNCVPDFFIDTDGDGVCNNDDICPGLDDALANTPCDDGQACTINDTYDANCNCVGTPTSDADNDGICDGDDLCPGFDNALIGTACDDMDPCTFADSYNNSCQCTGIFIDNDNDGVCNTNDVCPGFDDNLIGTPCEDGDPCTTGELYTSNCDCVGGVYTDSDSDGICNGNDACPILDDALIGTACNDGNPCTLNDVYDVTICGCIGTLIDADNDGVCDTDDVCPGFDDNLIGTSCDDMDACTTGDVYDGSCNCGGVFADADNDGVCDNDDVCPMFDDALIGSACDDLDACTEMDVIQSDCTCAGVFADADNDGVCDNDDICPLFDDSLIGTPCDDKDDCTEMDMIQIDCICLGVFADTDGDGVCDFDDVCTGLDDALIGTPCDDGNACTTGDTYDGFCNCVGNFTDTDNDGICDADDVCPMFDDALIGTGCDDGDACTTNDLYDNACNCVGVFTDSDNDGICDADDVCPMFDDALIGSPCDDMDACTTDDVYDSSCNCVGVFVDSDNDGVCDNDDVCPMFDDALIGSTCDDMNACTINDSYDVNCNCVGIFADSDGDGVCDNDDICLGINDALIGTPCDDMDSCTEGDVYDSNCECMGVYTDSDGDGLCDFEDACPMFDDGLIGTDCDDNNPNTTNDMVGADCICAGTLIDNSCMLEIPLEMGWNLISSYCIPMNPDMFAVFNDIEGNVIQVKDLNGTFAPAFSFNSIGDWDITSGYMVKMTTADTLVINGTTVDPLATPINLSDGWNMISYLLPVPSDPFSIYADINPQIIQFKDLNGTYVPSFNFNSLGNAIPTKGYMVKMQGNDVFIYNPSNTGNP